MPRTRWTRKIAWTALGLLLAGLAAPFVVVNFWRGGIAAALGRELGHPVRIGAVHLKVFGGLGFDMDNVAIADDPRFGVEPIARMESLRATLAPQSLWQGQLQFSSLLFVRPSLNIVRNEQGQWNISALGNEAFWNAAAPSAAGGASPPLTAGDGVGSFRALPGIQFDGGRINFKSGDRKSVFLVNDLDLEITPPSAPAEPWRLRFEGRPARTDVALTTTILFRGRAAVGPFAPSIQNETGTLAQLDISSENAFTGEVLKLITGKDQGIHGNLNLNLHLSGTTSLLRLTGTADLRELHRWDRLLPTGSPVLHADVRALLDVHSESAELQSLSIPMDGGAVEVQGDVQQLWHRPLPHREAQLRKVPLGAVVEIAKQFTTRLDPAMAAQGALDGRLQIAGLADTLSGRVELSGARVELKSAGQVARLSNVEILVERSTVKTGPVSISFGEGGKLASSLQWDIAKRELKTRLDGDAMRIEPFLAWARALGSRWGYAKISKGSLSLRAAVTVAPGQRAISGSGQIADAVVNSDAVNQLIQVRSARLDFQPGRVSVKTFLAVLGSLELRGSLMAKLPAPESNAAATGSHFPAIEFDCRASEIELAELDRLLNPRYRSQPLFGFGGARPGSKFFADFNASGKIEAPAFRYRGAEIKNWKAALDYHDRTLTMKSFSGELAGGIATGNATVRFALGAPAFNIESRLTNLDLALLTKQSQAWSGRFSGRIGGNLRLGGSGWTLPEVLEHLGGSGDATGANVELSGLDLLRGEAKPASLTRFTSLTTRFQIAKKEVSLVDLKMIPAPLPGALRGEQRGALSVSGSVGFDRALDLAVTEREAAQTQHWRGTLAEPVIGNTNALLRPAPVRRVR